MPTEDQIEDYIAGQPEPKRGDMQALDRLIRQIMPECRSWFLDGENSDGKIVSNPSIGYGAYTMKYADGTTKEFYQAGLSGNKAGISVYILGFEDRKYLARTYEAAIGKADVSGYCVKFKALKDINTDALEAAIRDGLAATGEN